jgi:hypothetical protein
MQKDKLDKLNKILGVMQNDTLTPSEVEKFLTMVLSVIQKSKESMDSMSSEHMKKMMEMCDYIENEHAKFLVQVDEKDEDKEQRFNAKLSEVKSILEEIKKIEVKDGENGKDADEEKIVADVLAQIKLPEYKETVLDTGAEIVAKINDLDTDDEDLLIDATHIKNLPKFVQNQVGGVVARNIYQMGDVALTSITNGDILQWDGTNKRWKNVAADDPTSTMATVSANSTDATKSLYTMTSTIPVEFRSSVGNSIFTIDETSQSVIFGKASALAGKISFNNVTNAFTQSLRGTNPGASIIYDLPTTAPTTGQALVATAPSGGVSTLSWSTIASGITIDTTTITGGATTQILYNNAGVVSSEAAFTYDFTNNALTVGVASLHSTGTRNLFLGESVGNFTLTGTDNVFIGYLAGTGNNSLSNLTAVGSEALRYWNSTAAGARHTAFGYRALRGSTTIGNNTGLFNSAFGFQSLYQATTADDNAAFGYRAGDGVTTADQNAIFGSNAGLTLSSGSNNVLVGYSAGAALSINSDNVIVGASAGLVVTSGSNVLIGTSAGRSLTSNGTATLIGKEAGQYLTVGDQVAIGYRALRGNSTPANNTGLGNLSIGYQAGLANSSGNYNIFLGYQAGLANSSGSGNFFLGYQAGLANISGGNNIFLGYTAGISEATGSANIFIGYQAGITANGSSSNVFIGNQAGRLFLSGTSTVLIGERSGYSVTGNYNSFIGTLSGFSTTSGVHNTFVGYQAGYDVTSQSYNTIIGGNNWGGAFTGSISIGYAGTSTITANHQGILGTATADGYVDDWYFNGVTRSSPYSVKINASGGSGTNIAGASMTIAGGKATGNALGGDIILQTSDAGGSGTTLQSLTTKAILKASGNLGLGETAPAEKLEIAGNLAFTEGSNRYIKMQNQTASNTAGNNFTINGAEGNGTGINGNILFLTPNRTATLVSTNMNTGEISALTGTLTVQGTDTLVGANFIANGAITSSSIGNGGTSQIKGGNVTVSNYTNYTELYGGDIILTSGKITSGANIAPAAIHTMYGGAYDGSTLQGGIHEFYAGKGAGTATDGYILFGNIDSTDTPTEWARFAGTGHLQLSALAGATVDGSLWNDSIQKAIQVFESGVEQTLSGTLFTQTNTVTVANTVTQTALTGTGVGTLTLPANFFVAGKTIRLRMWGYYSSTGNPTITVRVKLGSTTIGTMTGSSGNGSNDTFEAWSDITCRTTGGTGTVFTQGVYREVQSSGLIAGTDNTSTTTVDTTASQAVSITVEWGTAAAGNTISATNFTLEVLN